MKEHILLSIPKGSKIIGTDGSVIIVDNVPDNAIDLIEAGATYLMLKDSAKDPLRKLSEERLVKIIEMRKSQKIVRDVGILEMALAEKKSGKGKDPESPEQTGKSVK